MGYSANAYLGDDASSRCFRVATFAWSNVKTYERRLLPILAEAIVSLKDHRQL